MRVEVRNHLLFIDGKQVPFRATPNKSGTIKPEVLVLHDTAGRIEGKGESSISWLCNPAAKASAHLVMGRDREASITQLAPFNIATWHAGASNYKGRANVNGFSIGIEIVNPGSMSEVPGGAFTWWKQTFPLADYGIVRRATKEHGNALWMPYTAAQVAMCKEVGRALAVAYGLKDVTTHWAISPGRKVDTNPLFPLEDVRAYVLGAATPKPTPEPAKEPGKIAGQIGVTTAPSLNFRRSPNGQITGSLPKGTRIEINSREGDWLHVTTPAGYSGYVHGNYVKID